MTELTQVGLITQIEQLVVPYWQLALWSLGQSGFGIKGGATIAYIHPYLSDSGAALGDSQLLRHMRWALAGLPDNHASQPRSLQMSDWAAGLFTPGISA